MTGTASSKSKIFMDFDSYKNQEWLRRRKLRLEQVRKQSNEIARALRQKVSDEEKKRLQEYNRMRDEKFRVWKAEKLEELERKLKCALEGFGTGYKLAEKEPEPGLIMDEKIKLDFTKAQKRGEIAYQEELRRNKLAKENLMSMIDRKKMTRKREDLRSALVRSVPIKKEVYQETGQPGTHKITLMKKKIKRQDDNCNAPALQKSVPEKNTKKKYKANHKSCTCKCQPTEPKTYPAKGVETFWINLDEMQISSAGDSGPNLKSCESSMESKKSQKEKSEGAVEFYDFSSRYYCKSFKEFPHLVEKIKHDSEELNANELAKMEEKMEEVEVKKKLEIDVVSQERGREALRKEKINRDYNNLMIKLEELNKKEKILKSQQRNPPSFLHMNDERLSERIKMRQRLMESKFEKIYYEATAKIPSLGLPHSEPVYNMSGGGDCIEAGQEQTTRLSFSASNLKNNSPVSSSGKTHSETSTPQTARHPEASDSQKQLLIHINNALKEGRELRNAVSRNWKSDSSEREEEKEEMSSNIESEVSPGATQRTLMKCQESQTEILNGFGDEDSRLKNSDRGEDSLPMSTSTSYKSPPEVIRCEKLQQLLDYLERLSDTEERCILQNSPKLRRKMNVLLHDLLHEQGSVKRGKNDRTSPANPTLAYYIEKLLNMSRECVANLSVSSENISTPNITDLDVRNESDAPDSESSSRPSFLRDDLMRKFSLERINVLGEKSVRNWKMILEKKSEGPQSEHEDVLDSSNIERAQPDDKETEKPFDDIHSPMIKSRYDEITKKCSERISELSGMLDKVRKDKEKLLSSASGASSLNLNKIERNSEKEFYSEEEEEEEKILSVRRQSVEMSKPSPVLEGFINRYDLTRPRKESISTTAIADSQSLQEFNESLESWPDVMDELLKREILTSPFKWSDGELSSEFMTINDSRKKPSSIESVIGNFRKEIDKIKPFSLAESCSLCISPTKPRWSANGECQELFSSPERKFSWTASDAKTNRVFKEESSVESINHYLTSLGLNWAKSFLRKNAESRAMSSSSNSEKRFSDDEDENYH